MQGYYINTNTGTIHKIGGCHISMKVPIDMPKFAKEDDAIKFSKNQKYVKYCKWCFKNR